MQGLVGNLKGCATVTPLQFQNLCVPQRDPVFLFAVHLHDHLRAQASCRLISVSRFTISGHLKNTDSSVTLPPLSPSISLPPGASDVWPRT